MTKSSKEDKQILIDRAVVCPVLLRCFWKVHQHLGVTAFRQINKDVYPEQEVQVYTWPDASLREITELLKDAIPMLQDDLAQVSFRLVFVDKGGFWQFKPFGTVEAGRTGPEDSKCLAHVRFECGDMLDIAIFPRPPASAKTSIVKR